ncbi:minor histocompatibility protein HA-1-like [Tropilaelaps mercedesae]|uniref:Minor histocompatibility protein HA-1-like n=1 Tax=Tropilaelaps mercedesae TaxID=418985 RepID=A0A1V9X753_9ACAR|nr:minor histocompatibility protein HA-1-like [Tropilaelaps mercedesae]
MAKAGVGVLISGCANASSVLQAARATRSNRWSADGRTSSGVRSNNAESTLRNKMSRQLIDMMTMSVTRSDITRVSEYLMGDLDTNTCKARSCENLTSPDSDHPRGYESVTLTAQDVDARLMRLNEGVECALRRAKVWSKYAKDVMSYVEKRAQMGK